MKTRNGVPHVINRDPIVFNPANVVLLKERTNPKKLSRLSGLTRQQRNSLRCTSASNKYILHGIKACAVESLHKLPESFNGYTRYIPFTNSSGVLVRITGDKYILQEYY